MTNGGLPGAVDQMGDTASVFEAICQRRKPHLPAHWPAENDDQLQLVLLTRKSLGMSWTRQVTCPVDDHSQRSISPEQSAALRDPAIFMIPHGDNRTVDAAMIDLFAGGTCLDFSYPGPGICPSCGIVPSDFCFWNFSPFSAANAPDRLFISSTAVAADADIGVPPHASQRITMGVEYSLVAVVYHIWGGSHYVTQFLLQNRWVKYDCTSGGGTTTSATYDSGWNSGTQVLYVYVRSDLQAAPTICRTTRSVLPDSVPGLSAAFLRAVANVENRHAT